LTARIHVEGGGIKESKMFSFMKQRERARESPDLSEIYVRFPLKMMLCVEHVKEKKRFLKSRQVMKNMNANLETWGEVLMCTKGTWSYEMLVNCSRNFVV
jgi:hypothetical protein